MARKIHAIWSGEHGQNITEYAVGLLSILVLVIGTVRIVGGKANNIFSAVANEFQQHRSRGE